jgi:hypothetical protein
MNRSKMVPPPDWGLPRSPTKSANSPARSCPIESAKNTAVFQRAPGRERQTTALNRSPKRCHPPDPKRCHPPVGSSDIRRVLSIACGFGQFTSGLEKGPCVNWGSRGYLPRLPFTRAA